MAEQSEGRGQVQSAHRFRQQAEKAYGQADLVREALTQSATMLGGLDKPRANESAQAASGT
jgi:hypothetical protein